MTYKVKKIKMGKNKTPGEKVFLLAQSYMPAQDIHILKNPSNEEISPWYPVNFGEMLKTPEWIFNKSKYILIVLSAIKNTHYNHLLFRLID